jgi:hypothetical protein
VQTLVEDLYEIYSAKLEDSKIASSAVAAKKPMILTGQGR